MADKELEELTLLQEYLPTGLSESEIRSVVQGAIKEGFDQMGTLMAHVMPMVQGRVDGSEVNRIVREELKL